MSAVRAKSTAKKSRLIDIKEVSYRTGMGQSTIWHKVKSGEFIQPIRVKSGITRWLESDIDAWINDLAEVAKR